MGRTGRAYVSLAWHTGHSLFPTFRLDIGNEVSAGFNYSVSVFDGRRQGWFWDPNMSGHSEAVADRSGDLTDVTIRFEEGALIISAGETEIVNRTITNADAAAALGSVRSIWLVGSGTGSAWFDYVNLSGLQGTAASESALGVSDSVMRSRWADMKRSNLGGKPGN